MPEKYCLLLGIEKSRDRALLAAARTTKLKIALMYSNGTINNHRFADIILMGDPNRPEDVLKSVEEFEIKTGKTPAYVIPLTEMTIMSGFAVAQKYSLPYMNSETIKCTRDKHFMKEKFIEHGLKVARHKIFSTFQEMQDAARLLDYPLVIKPRNAGGSEGVMFVENEQQLQDSYQHLCAVAGVNHTRYGLESGRYQIEEFIVAKDEVSVEVINSPYGRAVCTMTDKYITDLPFFVELGHTIPSKWLGNTQVKQAALQACEALQLDRGIAHVELKISATGEPTVIEVNARPAGDCIMDLAERVTGTNLFALHIASYTDTEFRPPQSLPQNGRASIAFLDAGAGVVNRIHLPSPDNLPAEVVSLNIWTKAGQVSQACFDSNGRDGAVEFYWAEQPDEYIHLAFAKKLSQQIFQ